MNSVIDKELISQLLKLESDQQEKVLAYVKELIAADEIVKRAKASEDAIGKGRTKNFEQFNESFEQWKTRKRAGMI